MKITKAFAAILALMLVLALGLTLVACGGGDDPCTEHFDADANGKCDNCDATVEPDEGGITGDGTISLVSGGAASFKVVASVETQTALGKSLTNFVKTLNQCIEEENVELVLDTQTATDIEILVGSVTTRGAEYALDPYALGYDGYAVRVIGNKIVVIAGSNGAYRDALAYLEETVFGINDSTEFIDNVTVTSASGIEAPQTEFDLTVTVDGADFKEYVFAINEGDEYAESIISEIRAAIYKKTGAYLETVLIPNLKDGQYAFYLETLELNGDRTSENGYAAYVDENKNIHFESEFPDQFVKTVLEYLKSTITENKKSKVTISGGTIEQKDLRNIYYSDFGAKGDGVTDDFAAIKACHDYANTWGNTVHGDAGKTYYIGKNTNGEAVLVQTDTYWHGANFIVDDSEIEIHYSSSQCNKDYNGKCTECLARSASIFYLDNDRADVNVSAALKANLPILGGYGESDNTQKFENWPLDYDSLVVLGSSERKVFIRYGANADGGDEQYEIILVHADGTIDPSTPLTWDYTNISWATAYAADDKPITIDGALYDEDGNIVSVTDWLQKTTRPENNKYISTARNIMVSRSNSTIKNFEHRMTDDWEFRTPYGGILYVNRSHNTLFENIVLQQHDRKYEAGVISGTYEIGGSAANATSYVNVRVSNFFCDGGKWDYSSGADNAVASTPGAVEYRGCMGSNYCRNFYFEGCTLTSFDAHKGLGNLKIVNCTFEHINIFGSGVAEIYDSTVYVDGGYAVFNFREDYGATWRGDVIIDNVTMKYCNDYKATNSNNELYVINSKNFIDFDFDKDNVNGSYVDGTGSTNYLPINVTIKDLKLVRYTYEYVSPSHIIETEVPLGTTYLYMYHRSLWGYKDDISKFKDDGGYTNNNRLICTEYVYIENCNVEIKFPNTPQFEDIEIEYGPAPTKED